MKPRSAKAKGRRLQDKVAKDIVDTFSIPEESVRGAIMGESGTDIKIDYSLRQTIPYSIECKNQERVNVWGAIKQSESNCKEGTTPIVIIKKNNVQPWVLVPWDHFLELINK